MFIHNTTFNIYKGSLTLWRQWLRNSYLKKSISSNLFNSYSVLKVHFENEEEEIITIQFKADSRCVCTQFDQDYIPVFKQELFLTFGEKVLLFTTHLEELEA